MSELNSAINYFLQNGPVEEVDKLKRMIDQVKKFANDVYGTKIIDKNKQKLTNIFQVPVDSQSKCSSIKINGLDHSFLNLETKKSEVSGGAKNNNKIVYRKSKCEKTNNGTQEVKFTKRIGNGLVEKDLQNNETINQHHETLAHATTKNASDGNHYAENLSDGSNASDWEVSEDELSKLRQPLFDGWKRETIVSHITRNGEVQGIVRYYAPGSLVELTDIGQIEQILPKHSTNLTTDNFNFSTRPILGGFLQPFHSLCEAKYYYTTEANMIERIKQYQQLRLKCNERKRNRDRAKDCNSETMLDNNCDTLENSNKQSVTPTDSTVPSFDRKKSDSNDSAVPSFDRKEDDSNNADPLNATIDHSKDDSSESQDEDECGTGEPKIKLTQIERSNNYYDQSNYIYSKTPTRTATHSYFRCKNFVRHGCKARVVASHNDFSNAVLRRGHNHRPSKEAVDDEKFNKRLDANCKADEFKRPLKLYLETKKDMNGEIDTTNVPPPKSKESFIRRRRLLNVPKLPKTITEFIDILSDEDYKKYALDQSKSKFFRGNWEVDGAANLAFVSQRSLELLNTLDNVILMMDGTFKVLPRHFRRRFRQLYVVNVVYNGRCYPLAFILMHMKNFNSYDFIFKRLRSLFPSVTVSCCMTDYEAATRKALIKNFPSARISGCYFHYVQAIHKAFKTRGMLKDEKFQTALQEVSALALLPNDFVTKGFEYINKKMLKQKSRRWNDFSRYYKHQWYPANISVYGLAHRTNNFSESLNNITNQLSGPKPNIWQLISNLKLLEHHKSDEFFNNKEGVMFITKKSNDMIALNKKIENATKLFEEHQDVETFLKNICFKEKLDSYFASRIFIDGVDEDDFGDDCDDDSEEIIPNWHNVELTFNRGSLKRKRSPEVSENPKIRKMALFY